MKRRSLLTGLLGLLAVARSGISLRQPEERRAPLSPIAALTPEQRAAWDKILERSRYRQARLQYTWTEQEIPL